MTNSFLNYQTVTKMNYIKSYIFATSLSVCTKYAHIIASANQLCSYSAAFSSAAVCAQTQSFHTGMTVNTQTRSQMKM